MGVHPFGGRVSRAFGERLAPEDAVLSYHDTRLRRADIDTLKGDWLTDNIIAFWEDYLEYEKMPEYPKAHIVLLRPSISHLLLRTQTSEVGNLGSALPDLSTTTHMFATINDNKNLEVAEGGSHWSLLVVSLIDGVAFHYDSMFPTNVNDADLLTHHLAIATKRNLKMVSLGSTPQQENGNDCGVFVCLMMQHLLLGKLLSAVADVPINMSLKDTQIDAAAGRKEMIRIIESRRKEAQKIRSRSKSPSSSKSRSPPRIGNDKPHEPPPEQPTNTLKKANPGSVPISPASANSQMPVRPRYA